MWKKAVYHTIALAIWLTLILTRTINRRFPQTLQGFTCGDPSLSRILKPNVYTPNTLMNISYAIPFCIMAIELAIHGRKSLKNFKITAIRCLKWTQQYFLVYILNTIILSYIKSISGFYRPYFLTECMPDLAINCTKDEYIDSNYVCTNPNLTAFLHGELSRSFPSLNTMIATYPMVFIVWYLQQRISRIPLLLPIVAAVAFAWTLFASITRITVNAHHPVDIVGAVILLIPFTLYLNCIACKNFRVPTALGKESFRCLGKMKCSFCTNTKTVEKTE